jgi:hypothetical protein
MMQQSRGNVRRAEAFFEQPFNQLVLPLVLTTPERRANLLQHHVCASLFHFHNRGRPPAVDSRIGVAFDAANLKHLTPGGE